MEPIFDRNCRLTAWMNPDTGEVFTLDRNFVAFVRGGGVFTPRSHHLGYFLKGVFRDKHSKAVAFLRDAGISHPALPATPAPPAMPATPAVPATPAIPAAPAAPAGGFSTLSWDEFLRG